MSDQVNADRAEERVSSDSGLFISAEPLQGGGRLSAKGDDDSDATDTVGRDAGEDSDSGITDAVGLDTDASDAGDADASDAGDAGDTDGDGTDMGDSEETESGLPGENPLGLTRERPAPPTDHDGSDS